MSHHWTGCRFRLESMNDPYDPVPAGSTGRIDSVVPMGETLHLNVTWDQGVGRSLNVVVPPDRVTIIEDPNERFLTHWDEEHVPVDEVRPGDLLDLEDDAYADPKGDNPIFPYELSVVTGRVVENPGYCIRLDFEHDSVGFPPGHRVKRLGHDNRYDEES